MEARGSVKIYMRAGEIKQHHCYCQKANPSWPHRTTDSKHPNEKRFELKETTKNTNLQNVEIYR